MSRDAAIRSALLGWYAGEARDLPWRRTRDPYRVWVSEIMLQQTRVDTVVPYYQRFLRRFPTTRALAAAKLEDVLGAWSGLGYYRRARTLHLAAQEVVERHGGELPAEPAELASLAGIGPYTAGAILSIAFGRRAALVDGNVARVLARLEAIDDEVARGPGKRKVWEAADRLVDPDDPGGFNQALMELGATVCTRAPRCERCPVTAQCRAREQGRAAELPRATPKRAPRAVPLVALVAGHAPSGEVLFGRRPPEGLFGGLWEPPLFDGGLAALGPALRRAGLGRGAAVERAGELTHVLTHRRLEVVVARARPVRRWRLPARAPGPYEALAWRRPEELPLSTLARRILGVGLSSA